MKHTTITDPEVAKIIAKGGSVFVKFASTKDKIFPGEEVAVCDKKKNIIATGQALLNSDEMAQFRRGLAVIVR